MSRSMTTVPSPALRQARPPAGLQDLRVAAVDEEFLRQRAFPWAMLASGVLLSLLAPSFTSGLNWLPFMISLFLFGMPHGAMDWSVRNQLNGTRGLARQLVGFIPYLLLMAFSSLSLFLAPVLTFAAFMLLTVFHFGTADLIATGHGLERVGCKLLFIAGRGCLILGPAFAFHTAAAWLPFGMITGLPVDDGVFLSTLGTSGALATVAGITFALIHAGITFRHSSRLAALDLVESALIVLLGTLAAPLFAIGLFFLSTHAYRHSVRLSSAPIAGAAPTASSLGTRLFQMHLKSLPLLIPTFVIIPIWCLIQFGVLDPFTIITVTIGFFVISTLPHHLLGLLLPAYRP